MRALASHQCDLGSIAGLDITYELSLLLVLVLALKRFFSRYSGFPLFSKAMFSQLVLLEIYGNSKEKVCVDIGLKGVAILLSTADHSMLLSGLVLYWEVLESFTCVNRGWTNGDWKGKPYLLRNLRKDGTVNY